MNTNTTKVSGTTSVSTASLLNGKTRHDRKGVRKSTNTPLKAIAAITVEEKLAKALSEVAALRTEKKNLPKAAKSKQVAYLREGVTGKQLATSAKGLGNAINEQALSLSKVLALVKANVSKVGFIIEEGKRIITPALIAQFPTAKVADITPANLLVYRTPAQIAKGQEQIAKYGFERFTVAAVRSWAVSFYKAKNGYVRVVKVAK